MDDSMTMMKQFLFFTFLCLCSFSSQAQPFAKAPKLKKKVAKIIEWVRSDFEKESVKGFTSEFDQQGRLVAFYDATTPVNERLTHEYDQKGRLLRSVEGDGVGRLVTKYIYGHQKKSVVETFRGKVYQTHYFYNKKGQAIEKKMYLKGGELGTDFLLKDRILYQYKKDSLSSEVLHTYKLGGRNKGQRVSTRKTIYEYNAKTRKRTKRKEYDVDGSLRSESIYSYDEKGRTQFILHKYLLEQNKRSIEFKYKAGKIWQIIEQVDNKRFVRIFTDGRLIRLRTYFGNKIFSIVDYQYQYY